MKKCIMAFAVLFLLSGCTGKLYTIFNPYLPKYGETKKTQGILVYGTINVIELYQNRILVDPSSGNQIGTADSGDCIPTYQMKFSTMTDYSNPRIIVYEPGIFETNKFGIVLENEVMKSVNTESNPTEAIKNIATMMPFVAAEKSNNGKKMCNDGPKFIGLYKAPDILPYEKKP